jgi:hypothetical protein
MKLFYDGLELTNSLKSGMEVSKFSKDIEN